MWGRFPPTFRTITTLADFWSIGMSPKWLDSNKLCLHVSNPLPTPCGIYVALLAGRE